MAGEPTLDQQIDAQRHRLETAIAFLPDDSPPVVMSRAILSTLERLRDTDLTQRAVEHAVSNGRNDPICADYESAFAELKGPLGPECYECGEHLPVGCKGLFADEPTCKLHRGQRPDGPSGPGVGTGTSAPFPPLDWTL